MKLKSSIFSVILITCTTTFTQINFEQSNLKALFDFVHSHTYQKRSTHSPLPKYYAESINQFSSANINTDTYYDYETNLGSYRANALESTLRMYEHTNDKIYLYEALLEINDIIDSRLDLITQSYLPYPKWFAFRSNFDTPNRNDDYWGNSSFTGRILLPLAHFVYIIYSQNNLYNTLLNLPTYTAYTTFGAYADWVKARLDESMNYAFNNLALYSILNGEIVLDGFRFGEDASIAQANYQGPFGSALVYYYLLTNSSIVGSHLAQQVYNYYYKTYADNFNYCFEGTDIFGNPDKIPVDFCDIFDSSIYPDCANSGIIVYDQVNDAYTFAHNGWRETNNGEALFIEDIGHAQYTLFFADIYNKFYSQLHSNITSNAYFDNANLFRFRNTLKKMKVNTSSGIRFHNNLNGTDFLDPLSCDGAAPFSSSNDAINYMFLNRFESTANDGFNTYETLMTYLLNDMGVDNTIQSDEKKVYGANMIGLADMVGAWMEKENYSLHYSDRKLFFNQNFYAKDKLIFSPKESQFSSFPDLTMNPWPLNEQFSATPTASGTILANNAFIIEAGVTSKICAGREVILGDGFEVLAGADVSISAGNGCVDETDKKLENSNHLPKVLPLTEIYQQLDEARKKQENNLQKSSSQKELAYPLLLPNPNDGLFNVFVNDDYLDGEVKIFDLYGKLCFQETINTKNIALNLNLSSGVYLFVVENQSLMYQDKFIVK